MDEVVLDAPVVGTGGDVGQGWLSQQRKSCLSAASLVEPKKATGGGADMSLMLPRTAHATGSVPVKWLLARLLFDRTERPSAAETTEDEGRRETSMRGALGCNPSPRALGEPRGRRALTGSLD